MRSFEHRNKGTIRDTAAAGNVKGAFRNARDIQPTTDDAALKNWIEEKGVTLLDFHKVSHPYSNTNHLKSQYLLPIICLFMIPGNGLKVYV